MRILLYSDLHISRTSSILPLGDDSKYTYRQKMILNTGEWLSQIMVNEKPDMIINLGDTFDQHTLTSYDIDVASKFFDLFTSKMILNNLSIPHLVLVGNHEMINQNFNAIALLNNIPNITVIDHPQTINNDLAFLPYCDYKDILEFPEGKFLFSHQDIQGSIIRNNFALPEGIQPKDLKTKYNLVFNGHIHKYSILNNIVNIGSVTTHSFSDDEESIPKAYIFNTETLDLQSFNNLQCPLFRKFNIQRNVAELTQYIDNLDNNYKYLLHVISPFEYKTQVKELLENSDKILNSRLNVKIYKEDKQEETTQEINLQTNIDISQTFKDFLNITELKYPKEYYLKVLEGVNI